MSEDSELNEHLRDEIERLRQRIKRLEEENDALRADLLLRAKAEEAKP